jgi:hypothetical protein
LWPNWRQTLTRPSLGFLDEDLRVTESKDGHHWTPETGQLATPVYTSATTAIKIAIIFVSIPLLDILV